MARDIYSRLKIGGKLEAETPLHVGGVGGSTDSDMALAVNGKGEFYVPGTSLTGVLRAWCEEHFGNVDWVFGFQKNDSGHASFVLIEDATIENANEILTEIRDGVGIDRFYGTAADKTKYDREILPKGTQLKFEMTVEIGKEENEAKTKAIFAHLVEAMKAGELRFGGSRTRGLGRLRLIDLSFKEQKLKGFDNILKLLRNESEDVKITDELKKSVEFTEKPGLEITIDWSPVQPVMVKAGFEGIGVDMLPLVSQKSSENLALVLPGSSIKGALRAHAERIMRTLLDCEDKNEAFRTKNNTNFHDQINKIPLINELFGAKAESDEKADKKGRIGALSIDDCFAEQTFDRKSWNEITTEKTTVTKDNKELEVSYAEQPLWKALDKIKHLPKGEKNEITSFQIEHHNAIDRFTGGAADGALYSVLVPTKIVWDKMRFSLDFSRTKKPRQCLMLLLLVLRDLAENRLPLGFATTRGMGEIKVNGFELKGKNLETIGLSGDISIKIENGKFVASETLKNLGGEDWWETN
jgi:Uncharacterized protein predicted to be involved in DNA repair (RAMP superfamily)